MRILLVDDDDSNLKLLQILLESEQHRTVMATNGQEALQRAKDAPPELVISDILMPVMDGYALCRAWVADAELRDIPFVFYTATYQTEEDEAFGLSLGAAAFLRKPMEPDLFLTEVQRVIHGTAKGVLKAPGNPPMVEESYLKLYNERLVQKLDNYTKKLFTQVSELQNVQSLLRLKSLALEAAANGIVIIDLEGTIEWFNQAFLDITGFAHEEVIGRNLRMLRSGVHQEEFFKDIWDTILAGRVWNGEIINRSKDGSLRTIRAAITPVRDETGAITHFIDIIQDITEQRRMESELRQSQKIEAVGRLAGGVAHDFNNMVSVILINAEFLLLDEGLSPAQRMRLLEIQQAAERSTDLTRQLLAFSRKQPAQPKSIDLNEVVKDNHKMLQRMIEVDIDLAFRPGQGLWPVFMDPSQVGQILANLVINARDALPGAGTISIETANSRVDEEGALLYSGMTPGDYVQLTVSDTGCGMPPTVLEHIFEPFFTTKVEGKGTGLGLATVYGIVKQNHGSVRAYSQLGIGSSLKVYLPRFQGEDLEVPAAAEAALPGGSETILLAEDEEAMLNVIRTVLERMGYTVLAAPNPLDVFLLGQRHDGPIHLLVTDVVMPGLNGYELQARLAEAWPGLKTLYLSGYPSDIIAKRGLIPEGTHFLQKPFRIQDLSNKVREVLDS